MGYFEKKWKEYQDDKEFYARVLQTERVKAQEKARLDRVSLLKAKARAKAEYEALPVAAKLAVIGKRIRHKLQQIDNKLENIRS